MINHLRTCALVILASTFSMGVANATGTGGPDPVSAPSAQTATCAGVVVDELGDPLMGATVRVEGTKIAAATNLDGEFSLSNVPVGSKITVTYVGYSPQTIVWNGTALNFKMEPNTNALDEVVVVGFGTQKKVNLTGAVSTVSAKELTNRPINSVSDALQGLVPGLNVLSSNLGGQLNGTRSMNIRGTGTIGTGASVTPLILIDGMEAPVPIVPDRKSVV